MIRVHNKSSKPDNIVIKEHKKIEEILALEKEMPPFMKDYFIYLKNAVAVTTRLAYLKDIHFFLTYLLEETTLTKAKEVRDISEKDFDQMKARDLNRFLGDYCTRYYKEQDGITTVYENHNRSLSRKKSSLSSLFKFLYRNEQISKNITDGLNPIKMPKPQPDAIKRLQLHEIENMLDAVKYGHGLTPQEKKYWEKTKLRDKAILLLFVTYGLRLKELQELNLSSFNFTRGEFRIYRKRGKESVMPLNRTIEKAIKEYVNEERDMTGDEDALFLSLQRTRLTERAIRKLVKKYTSIAMETTREDGYSPHKLRATAASTLIEQGFSIYDVQNILDHDNVTTTQLYSAHKKNAKRDIIAQFELDDE